MSALGLIVWPDGRKSYQRLPDSEAGEYEALSSIVGGYIEYVYVTDGVHAYCNEEGKLQGLPANLGVDLLVGTVIFLGDDGEGNEADLPPEWQGLV